MRRPPYPRDQLTVNASFHLMTAAARIHVHPSFRTHLPESCLQLLVSDVTFYGQTKCGMTGWRKMCMEVVGYAQDISYRSRSEPG